MIPDLPAPLALRLLSAVAGPRLRISSPNTPPTPDLLAALTAAFGPALPDERPPTDAELARAALTLAAEDPATEHHIEALIGSPPTMGAGTTIAAVTASIAILQSHVRLERTPAGEWSFVFEKKSASDALVNLGHALHRALGGTPRAIDVLIITAIDLEYNAVLDVHSGAAPVSTWQKQPGPTGFEVATRVFQTATGKPLRIAVTRPSIMGMAATAAAAAPLITAYRPKCLAMCGVCAGRRGEVELGDVIIADRLFTYDTGMTATEMDAEGRTIERFAPDLYQYSLHAVWHERARDFRPANLPEWIDHRPHSNESQTQWLLARLRSGEEVPHHPDRPKHCASFTTLVPKLREKGLLEPKGLALTPAGETFIDDLLLLHPDGLPEPKTFQTHVGVIASGSKLVRDARIWEKLSQQNRKILGLEMEAAAIGFVAHVMGVERAIVMKGVMDFADSEKNDGFKAFAARASAECLIEFLRSNVEG